MNILKLYQPSASCRGKQISRLRCSLRASTMALLGMSLCLFISFANAKGGDDEDGGGADMDVPLIRTP